jgi:hypothetical protein
MIDTIHSPEALANPYGNKVTLSREFLEIPVLQGVITDTHFVKRDRSVEMAAPLWSDLARHIFLRRTLPRLVARTRCR